MQPTVTVVVCGAPLASRTADLAAALVDDGWDTTIVATPASAGWLDFNAVASIVKRPVRSQYRSPSEPKSGGPPRALVVCPATFNTVNKAVAGIADNYAMGVLCEALGSGIPVLMLPMVNQKLWGHFAWQPGLEALADHVIMLDVHTGEPGTRPVLSGTGEQVTAEFQPAWVTAALRGLV